MVAPKLTTHLELDSKNGIHATTGSLGHGLPISTGMALGRKLQGIEGRVIVMISDGECQEGTTWESLLIAARHQLSNLLVLVDYNKIQALTTLEEALPLDDLAAKFRAFNWDCDEVADGHDFTQLLPVLQKNTSTDRPRAVLLTLSRAKASLSLNMTQPGMQERLRETNWKLESAHWGFHEKTLWSRPSKTSRHRSANLCHLW